MKLQEKNIEAVKEINKGCLGEDVIHCKDEMCDMLVDLEDEVIDTLQMNDSYYVFDLIQAVYFNDKEMLDSMKQSLVF